jgi:hypothetical protein
MTSPNMLKRLISKQAFFFAICTALMFATAEKRVYDKKRGEKNELERERYSSFFAAKRIY